MNRPLLILASIGLLLAACFGIALAILAGLATVTAVLAGRGIRALTGGCSRETETAAQGGIRRVWNDGRGTIIDM
jgi:hypothetical protein